jgi:uncharacterized protein related to proFAR isomerase
MATPMEILMRSVIPNRTPPSGSAMPTIATAGVMPQTAPAAQVQPTLSPTAKYIADMQALMGGGIGRLSTGEKISALGQVLQAAGSRGAADPAAVLQNVRQQQMQKLNMQYQIAQSQQKMQQEQQKRAFITQYASTVPEDKRGLLENADIDKAFDIVEKELTAKKQLFQIVDGPAGNKVAVFSDFSRVETDFPNNLETDLVDRGSQKLLINKDNGEVIKVYDKDLSPSVIARRRGSYSPPKPAGRATDVKNPAKKTTAAVVAPDLLAAITKRLNQVN